MGSPSGSDVNRCCEGKKKKNGQNRVNRSCSFRAVTGVTRGTCEFTGVTVYEKQLKSVL